MMRPGVNGVASCGSTMTTGLPDPRREQLTSMIKMCDAGHPDGNPAVNMETGEDALPQRESHLLPGLLDEAFSKA